MPDAEVLVRVVLGGLFLGGLLMFFAAPESRRPDVPTSVRHLDEEHR